MKVSTVVIWAFEFGVMAVLAVLAFMDIDNALLYFFLTGLVIVLAIFGNKQFSVKANGIELEVKDEEEKDGK